MLPATKVAEHFLQQEQAHSLTMPHLRDTLAATACTRTFDGVSCRCRCCGGNCCLFCQQPLLCKVLLTSC